MRSVRSELAFLGGSLLLALVMVLGMSGVAHGAWQTVPPTTDFGTMGRIGMPIWGADAYSWHDAEFTPDFMYQIKQDSKLTVVNGYVSGTGSGIWTASPSVILGSGQSGAALIRVSMHSTYLKLYEVNPAVECGMADTPPQMSPFASSLAGIDWDWSNTRLQIYPVGDLNFGAWNGSIRGDLKSAEKNYNPAKEGGSSQYAQGMVAVAWVKIGPSLWDCAVFEGGQYSGAGYAKREDGRANVFQSTINPVSVMKCEIADSAKWRAIRDINGYSELSNNPTGMDVSFVGTGFAATTDDTETAIAAYEAIVGGAYPVFSEPTTDTVGSTVDTISVEATFTEDASVIDTNTPAGQAWEKFTNVLAPISKLLFPLVELGKLKPTNFGE